MATGNLTQLFLLMHLILISMCHEFVSEVFYKGHLEKVIESTKRSNCLIIINNYQLGNLQFSLSPLLVNAPTAKASRFKENCPTHPFSLNNNSKTFDENFSPILWCPTLNLKTYSSVSKPWICSINIDLFPATNQSINISNLPQRPVFPNIPLKSDYTSAYNCPFHILVTHSMQPISSNKISNWIKHTLEKLSHRKNVPTNYPVMFDIFFHAIVSATNVKIDQLETLNPHSLSKPISWKLYSDGELANSVHRHFASCFDHSSDKTWIEASSFRIKEKLGVSYTMLWQDVFKNYTFDYFDPSLKCINENLYPENLLKNTDYRYDIMEAIFYISVHSQKRPNVIFSIEDKISALKFVSCVKTHTTYGFEFDQMVSVFDNYIWICLVITIFGVAKTFAVFELCYFRKRRVSRLAKHIFALLKVILEQGDGIPDSLNQMFSLRFLIAAYLLIALVVSNAYKNTNVYNLIAPKRVKPYETFNELVKEKFDIYSRPSELVFDTIPKYYNGNIILPKYKKFDAPHKFQPTTMFNGHIESEVQQLISLPAAGEKISTFERTNILLHNKTRLHPKSRKLLKEFSEWCESLLNQSRIDEFKECGRYVQKTFLNSDQTFLYDSFEKCNKTALILPEHMCNKFAKRLAQNNRLNSVFATQIDVGIERYSTNFLTFEVGGWLSPQIVQRLRATEIAGLWNWWTDFFYLQTYYESEGWKNREIRKPTMEGNIVIIFVILAVGLVISNICFTVEVWHLVVNILQKLIKRIMLHLNETKCWRKNGSATINLNT